MRWLDLFRTPEPREEDVEVPEEESADPLPRVSLSELWPPSPRVKVLYIGLGFFLFNVLLICIWGYVLASNT